MKKTLTLLGLSACVLLVLNSCSSGHMSEYDYETATTASDTIADGEIPPWLIDDEDDGWGGQIAAGATTHEHYRIPEPEESVADVYGSGASQNQPTVAHQGATVHTTPADTVIETPSQAIAANTPGTPHHIGIEPTPAKPQSTTSKPKPKKATAKSTAKKDKKADARKRAKRYTEPTLLTYKVRRGDNLSDIAKRSRTTVRQIKKDSGLTSDTIYPGQVIKVRYIPKDYKPTKSKNNRAQNGKGKTRTHVVAKGQTISGIAKQYGVSYTEIMKANGMSQKDAMRMRPGKRLVIPAKKR